MKALEHKFVPKSTFSKLAISVEEKADLSEIQNATKTKIHLPFLSNEDFHTLQNTNITCHINHQTKSADFQVNIISNNFDEIEDKNGAFQERFSEKNQTTYNPTDVRRPQVDGFIDQLIEGK